MRKRIVVLSLFFLCIGCGAPKVSLYPACDDTMCGYIDKTGTMVIDQKFDEAGDFSWGLAAVRVKSVWGYIDKSGEFVIEPQYEYATKFSRNGLAAVYVSGKYGFIDRKGAMVIAPAFDSILFGFEDQELAAVMVGGKLGYIDSKGVFRIPPTYTSADGAFYGSNSFRNGYAAVPVSDKWGFIDRSGKMVIAPQFKDNEIGVFGEYGLVPVRKDGKWGLMNVKGEMEVEGDYDYVSPFIGGLAAVYTDKKWGFINRLGRMVITPQYDETWSFTKQGLCAVKIAGKWGYINKKGELVIAPQFYKTYGFDADLAIAYGDRVGYIDKTGKMVWSYEKKPELSLFRYKSAGLSYDYGYNEYGEYVELATQNYAKERIYDNSVTLTDSFGFEVVYYKPFDKEIKNIMVKIGEVNAADPGVPAYQQKMYVRLSKDKTQFTSTYSLRSYAFAKQKPGTYRLQILDESEAEITSLDISVQ